MLLGPVEEDVMRHLSAGDFLMSFLLSGRSTRAFYREAHQRARARYYYARSIEGLRKKGLVTRDGDVVRLTEKGEELEQILLSRQTESAAAWTGSWWIVMYDIPVTHNEFRFQIRSILVRAGFRKLQHSVWINPHHCKELEAFLKNNPRVNSFVRYVEARPFAGLETMSDWRKLTTT